MIQILQELEVAAHEKTSPGREPRRGYRRIRPEARNITLEHDPFIVDLHMTNHEENPYSYYSNY